MADPECEHDWCYAPYVLAVYPPQYPRICRKCGRRQIVVWNSGTDLGEYDRLVRQWAAPKESPDVNPR